jgi:tetratricopeptide (TPR) repeat protein
MNQRSPKPRSPKTCLLILFAAAWLLPPSTAFAAKTLASEALATAIESGTLDQVKQELLMDSDQKQKFDFDEKGMEELGRSLVAQGNQEQGIEILQLNQMIHGSSPRAANALGDAYRDSGNDLSARMYYDMALNLDPENEHAKKATARQGDAEELAMEAMANAGGMGDWELDPEAMQAAMAQMGQELSPEQMQEMQEAMAQIEAYQQDPESYRAAGQQRAEQPQQPQQSSEASAAAETAYESEFCEVLHRFNARKQIEDSQARSRVEGHYGAPGDTLRTWNVESACGEFLIAIPLWADVSPPVMGLTGPNTFEDATGGWWEFDIGGDGRATGVIYTAPEGRTTEMKRLGDPKSLD